MTSVHAGIGNHDYYTVIFTVYSAPQWEGQVESTVRYPYPPSLPPLKPKKKKRPQSMLKMLEIKNNDKRSHIHSIKLSICFLHLNLIIYIKPVLRIRIHRFRIRIKHFK
jgi:hypothetical protein